MTAMETSGSARLGTNTKLIRNIGCLYTLQTAASKGARRIGPDDLSPVNNAAMVIRSGKVVWIGAEKSCPSSLIQDAEVEDVNGAVILPAFVESHTHLVFAGHRAAEFERRLQGESYQSIGKSGGGILSTVRATRAASEDELLATAQKRLDRFTRQGVGTLEIKSGYGLNAETEMKILRTAGRLTGARIVRTFLGAHAIPEESASARAYLEELARDVLPQIKRQGLAKRVDIFVEEGYFPVDEARPYLQQAKAMGFDLAVHADQMSRSLAAQLAVEVGARSAEHLIQINEDDIAILARSEVTSVLLPSSDLYMKCAYPPARALIDAGARVALATDFNPGSSPSADLALGGLLARLQMGMTLPEVIVAYTLGGAYALGLQKEIGSLEVGKCADFIVIEGELAELFFAVGHQPVSALYREGHKSFGPEAVN